MTGSELRLVGILLCAAGLVLQAVLQPLLRRLKKQVFD